MAPEQAEDIFYEAYRAEMMRQHANWSKPIIQHEVRMKAYEALIDAIQAEQVNDMAAKYLARSASA